MDASYAVRLVGRPYLSCLISHWWVFGSFLVWLQTMSHRLCTDSLNLLVNAHMIYSWVPLCGGSSWQSASCWSLTPAVQSLPSPQQRWIPVLSTLVISVHEQPPGSESCTIFHWVGVRNLFSHSSADGQFGCFLFLSMTSKCCHRPTSHIPV